MRLDTVITKTLFILRQFSLEKRRVVVPKATVTRLLTHLTKKNEVYVIFANKQEWIILQCFFLMLKLYDYNSEGSVCVYLHSSLMY